MKSNQPVYESIALDLARRIADGEFAFGEKISGRTRLAGEYGVSPETVRKAIAMLRQFNVVAASQGKEVSILSAEQAAEFINHQSAMQSAYSLRQELELLQEKKKDIDERFDEVIYKITRYTDRLRNLQPFNPVEVKVAGDSHWVGKPISELKLWNHTGASVVAIRRGVEVIISPGPHAILESRDRLVVVGMGDILEKVDKYINKGPVQT
jgi:K+/H+ antiporter YhaU regulatory subunit KhtT